VRFDRPSVFSEGAAKLLERNVELAASAPRGRKSAAQRTYGGALQTRLTADWRAQTSSSDSELWSSGRTLRDRSRQMIRDNAYAKRAKVIVVNNVVGAGITMEPKVKNRQNKLVAVVNDGIEEAWDEWTRAENCHTGGKLHFCDLERQAFGQIFEAGEILIRKHYQAFGSSTIPFALELIEAERIADDVLTPVAGVSQFYRLGVERDEYGRPVAFWIRRYHPGEIRYAGADPNLLFRLPADQAYHLYAVDRWPQTRGEPWLHAAIRRLNDMDGYAEAEIVAARGAACRMGIITTPDEEGMADGAAADGDVPQFELEPGAVTRLAPGESYIDAVSNRPNPGMDPFMRLLLREVAAGVGPSYESLSRDYSQSNYSSSRLALLDDRDLWRVFQQFFIRSFREPLHREWLRQAVYANAITGLSVGDYLAQPSKFEAVSFKPRGWSWIDPTKEVQAYKDARRAGFISTGQIVALTGGGADLDETWDEIAAENQSAEDKGIVVTTDPGKILEARETDVAAAVPDPAASPSPAAAGGDQAGDAYARQFAEIGASLRALAVAIANQKQPIINVAPPPSPNVDVHLAPSIALPDPGGLVDRDFEVIERDENGFGKVIRQRKAA
jgi:lambda family phage portal protein